MTDSIKQFFQSKAFAVIGASSDRTKYGNKVLRCYLQHKKIVYPVNPKETVIEGIKVFSTIKDLPNEVKASQLLPHRLLPKKLLLKLLKKIYKISGCNLEPKVSRQSARV